MNKWSSILVKNEISTFLLDDLKEYFKDIPLNELEIISQKIINKKSLKLVKKVIIDNKKNISKLLMENLLEEISEIKEDLEWKSTSKGKSIIYINDWVQLFFTEFRLNEKFEDVYIGGHTENKDLIYVYGKVKTEADKISLLDYINSKKPELKLMINVQIK